MSVLVAIEVLGLGACFVGIWFINQARRTLTSDGRLTLLVLLSLVGTVHFIDALEWAGLKWADRIGDMLKIFTPAAWLFFLFVVRRDGLLQQVDRQDQQLDFFFQHAPMAVAVLDQDDRYLAVSQKWLELHQLKASPVGKKLSELNTSHTARWTRILAEAKDASAPQSGLEQNVDGMGGIWLEWRLRRFHGAHSKGGTILLVEDVTERIKQDQVRESTHTRLLRQQNLETIGEIAAGVAHDVNNLLQVISAHAAALEGEESNRKDFRESLDSIRDAVLSASGMTRWLLRQGRSDDIEYKDVNLTDLLHRVTHVLKRAIPRTQRLLVVSPADPVLVRGNETLLEQLIINLVLNARDAMNKDGQIVVSLRQNGQAALLEVEDQGIGIEDNIRDRILEPFFTTKGDRGTGMGLAVVHRVILAHGAQLQLSSQPGKGSQFSVHFPDPKHFDPAAIVEEAVSSKVRAL